MIGSEHVYKKGASPLACSLISRSHHLQSTNPQQYLSIAMGRTLVYPKVQKNTVHRKDDRGKVVFQLLEIVELDSTSIET